MSDTYIFREIDYKDKPFTLKYIGWYNSYATRRYVKVLLEKLCKKYPKDTILCMKMTRGFQGTG